MRTILTLLLVAGSVFAQTSETTRISKGDLLKQRQYQTNADLVFYVDPLGADANQCTSTGTGACLTIQGALNKAPKLLRHRVTVNVAAGNYAGFTITGFTIDPSIQRATAGILIEGTLGNVTPATGSATGTATAGTAGSGTTQGTLTDGAATWTVNDAAMVGKLITITGGTGSGTVRVICSNTATVITVCGTWTAPTGTSTYALQAPTSIITSTIAAVPSPIGVTSSFSAAAIQILNNNTTLGSGFDITIRNMGTSVLFFSISGPQNINIIQHVATSSSVSTISNNALMTVTDSSVTSTNSPYQVTGGSLTLLRGRVSSTSGGVIAASRATVAVSSIQFTGLTSATSAFISTSGNSLVTATSVRCDCGSTADTACAVVSGFPSVGPADPTSMRVLTGIDVTNCTYGVSSSGPGSIVFNQTTTFSGNSLTYSVIAVNSGQIFLPSAITITSGTADIALDNGAVTGSYAALTAIYSCYTSLGTLSSVCRL